MFATKPEISTIQPAVQTSGCSERAALVWTALSAAVVPLGAGDDPLTVALALARLPEVPLALALAPALAEVGLAEDDAESSTTISATVGWPSEPWAFWYGVLRPSN